MNQFLLRSMALYGVTLQGLSEFSMRASRKIAAKQKKMVNERGGWFITADHYKIYNIE